MEEADIDCQLRLTGCRELEHQPHPGGPPPCWRDGDSWLCHADTVPGGTIDPGALVGGLAHAARAAGAALHESAAVHALERGRPVRLHTTAGQVRADHVVVALNAWTTTLLELPIRFDAALTLAVCTAPLAPEAIAALGLSDAVPFYTLDLPYLWGRTLRDGRLILGAGLVGAPDGAVARIRLDDPEAVASLHRLMARLPGFHPALDDVEITHRWGGPIAFPASRTPVLGRLPDAANVIVSGGCAGHGIALGVRAGQLVADAIVDGTPLPSWGALPGAPQSDREATQAASATASVSSASASTSSTVFTGWKRICSRTSAGTSSRSPRLRSGRITSVSPAACAASTFCLTPPIGSTRPCSVTSPVMPTVCFTGRPREERRRCAVTSVTPALGPSFGIAPAGTWTWNSRLEGVVRDAERRGVAAHPGEGDARRLLHDVAELAGEHQPVGARHRGGLDEQHVAAGAGDREPGGDARHGRALRRLLEELLPAERLAHHRHVDGDRRLRRARRDARSRLAQQRAELALELPHAGLAGVVVDDEPQDRVVDRHLVRPQPVALDLPRPQVAARDRHLLGDRVAVEADHLHAVEQRPGNGVGDVGGRDEEHLRQVELDVEVVVAERVVLRRVEHLEQRRRRIAAPVGADLVDLVEHDDRVHGAGVAQGAHQPAGQRADVGPAMAADLRLVAHAAERHADELPARGARDRLADRGLAGARRADEASG